MILPLASAFVIAVEGIWLSISVHQAASVAAFAGLEAVPVFGVGRTCASVTPHLHNLDHLHRQVVEHARLTKKAWRPIMTATLKCHINNAASHAGLTQLMRRHQSQ